MFKSFRQIYTDMTQALVAAGCAVRDFRPGSILGAFLTAIAAVLSMGWLNLSTLLNLFYVNSSSGDYLRRRVGDLGMTVGQGTQASGPVMVTPTSSSITGTVPAGALLQANGLLFSVNADITIGQPFNVGAITCLTVGTAGNLNSGTILTLVNSPITGVVLQVGNTLDSSGNAQGNLTGGTDPESDDAIKARFPEYLLSLSRGTATAVTQALLATPGVQNLVVQNNTPAAGWLTISVTSPTSTIPQSVQAAIAQTMDAWSAAGIGYVLQVAVKTSVTVSVQVGTTDPTASVATIKSQVAAAIMALTQTLQAGRSIYSSDIVRAGYLPGLSSFTVLSADAIASPTQVLSIDTVNVSVLFQ